MAKSHHELTQKLLAANRHLKDEMAKNVALHLDSRQSIAGNTSRDNDKAITFGQRAADRVASFGGSWTFILLFATVMLVWVALNTFILTHYNKVFDPYPYILLNLFLSMLAAIQAPVILMSQNRQAEHDRRNAEHDYEVNLKAELEIMLLHEKVDLLRQGQWEELIELQRQQLALLTRLSHRTAPTGPPG